MAKQWRLTNKSKASCNKRNFPKSKQRKRTCVDASPGIFGRGGRNSHGFWFTLKNRHKSLFLRSKVSDLAFSHARDKTSSKRQKMAIIAAIMVINGNSKMALNSRSIWCQYTTTKPLFQILFWEFSTNLRSAGCPLPCQGNKRSGRRTGLEMPPSDGNSSFLGGWFHRKRETSKDGNRFGRMITVGTFRKEADLPEIYAEIPVHPQVRFFLKALIPILTEKRADGIAVFWVFWIIFILMVIQVLITIKMVI